MPELIVNQAPGAGVKRSWDSSTAIMLDKTVESIVNQAQCAGAKRSRVIGQSEYSDFVFTSLSDAIGNWEDTRNSKARDDLRFNILATVRKCNKPRQSNGVNSSNIFAHKTNMWFEGTDIHIAATLYSNERDRVIDASFFFDPNKCPKSLVVGEKVRLIGTRLQMWKGDLQLTGKNIRFGHSCVSMSLTDAIGAWDHVRSVQPILFIRRLPHGAEHHFPRLTMIVTVEKWGNATTTSGAQLHIIALECCIAYSYVLSGRDVHIAAEFSCPSNVDSTIRGSFFFEPLLQPQAFSVGDVVKLHDIQMQEWNGLPQLSGKNVKISVFQR